MGVLKVHLTLLGSTAGRVALVTDSWAARELLALAQIEPSFCSIGLRSADWRFTRVVCTSWLNPYDSMWQPRDDSVDHGAFIKPSAGAARAGRQAKGLTQGGRPVIQGAVVWGSQFGQSEEQEVGGIWPEVGGKPLPMLLLFDKYTRKWNSNVQMMSSSLIWIILHNLEMITQEATQKSNMVEPT